MMNRVNNLPEKYKAMMEEYQKVIYWWREKANKKAECQIHDCYF